MIRIKKILVFLIAVFILTCTAQSAYCKVIKKEVQIQTKDSRIIKSTITYVQNNKKKKYPTVLLVHSLGYSSEDWGSLIGHLNNAGYAVIAMDLRGHGKSIYDGKFKKKSWVYFNNSAYQKMPNDIVSMLNEVQKECKMVDLGNMAIVGADIGANASVLATDKYKKKPKTMVLICPTRTFKGLYIPIAMTDLNLPMLTMVSNRDRYCLQEQRILAKFSQGGFYAKNYPNGGMGMLMVKLNPSMASDITNWIKKYVH